MLEAVRGNPTLRERLYARVVASRGGHVNLVLLGPPGAGKGTQAERLRDDLGLCHLATGDLLRRHRAEGTALGLEAAAYMDAGGLVPDRLVVTMLLDALPDDVRDGRRGFLLDGFPRTLPQANVLADALRQAGLTLGAVLMLAVDRRRDRRTAGRPRPRRRHAHDRPPAA